MFDSPLSFKGAQWQVKSTVGPVYLARWDGGSWRVLAVFDGTKGDYHLDWANPTAGLYSAVDSHGSPSETVRIVEERNHGVVTTRVEKSVPVRERDLSDTHRRLLAALNGTPLPSE